MASLPLYVFSGVVYIFSIVYAPILHLNPIPQFQFAASCEELNKGPLNDAAITQLHGYCNQNRTLEHQDMPSCSVKQFDHFLSFVKDCQSQLNPELVGVLG